MTSLSPASALDHIEAAHAFLAARADLAPCREVNDAFGKLVGIARARAPRASRRQVLRGVEERIGLANLHRLCAAGEYQLERFWGERIRHAADPAAELRRFPYWDNYRKLARMEVAALRKALPSLRSLLFVGAGPLPLTSYMMATAHGLRVTNLDVAAEAAECATHWMVRRLGLRHVDCLHRDARDYIRYADHDVVALAALVGMSKAEKTEIIAHIHRHMRPGQPLMVRSVRGLRGLLYPEAETVLDGFRLARQIHPRGEVVNSALIFERV
jgi:nicotianamine synthase